MILLLKFFNWMNEVKKKIEKISLLEIYLLFSGSICLPQFAGEEFEPQGEELTPAGLDEHRLILLMTIVSQHHHSLCKSSLTAGT